MNGLARLSMNWSQALVYLIFPLSWMGGRRATLLHLAWVYDKKSHEFVNTVKQNTWRPCIRMIVPSSDEVRRADFLNCKMMRLNLDSSSKIKYGHRYYILLGMQNSMQKKFHPGSAGSSVAPVAHPYRLHVA